MTLGILGRVLDDTTISDVGNLAARYGVTEIVVRLRPESAYPVVVILRASRRITIGRDQTLPLATDDAFARLMHKIGETFNEEAARVPSP